MGRGFTIAFAVVQAVLAMRVIARLVRTAGGPTIQRTEHPPAGETVSVIVPVLDEAERLGPCLEGLISQGSEVPEILVVDGGSTDGTQQLVADFARRDARVKLVDASPIPVGWNGKAWGLHVGHQHSCSASPWLLTIDADVRPHAGLAASLLTHARHTNLEALSVATRQHINDAGSGLLHPAMLTTLVYRFGIPGGEIRSPDEVQANGQCFLVRRETLEHAGGFEDVRGSICEDITLARNIVADGSKLGFFEADDLVSVEMYPDWRTVWREWPRSLPMRDEFWGRNGVLGLLEVVLVQALPLVVSLATLTTRERQASLLARLNLALVCTRIGVLFGTSRAYVERPWTYWLSPLADLPVAATLIVNAFRRRYVWRGRELVRGGVE